MLTKSPVARMPHTNFVHQSIQCKGDRTTSAWIQVHSWWSHSQQIAHFHFIATATLFDPSTSTGCSVWHRCVTHNASTMNRWYMHGRKIGTHNSCHKKRLSIASVRFGSVSSVLLRKCQIIYFKMYLNRFELLGWCNTLCRRVVGIWIMRPVSLGYSIETGVLHGLWFLFRNLLDRFLCISKRNSSCRVRFFSAATRFDIRRCECLRGLNDICLFFFHSLICLLPVICAWVTLRWPSDTVIETNPSSISIDPIMKNLHDFFVTGLSPNITTAINSTGHTHFFLLNGTVTKPRTTVLEKCHFLRFRPNRCQWEYWKLLDGTIKLSFWLDVCVRMLRIISGFSIESTVIWLAHTTTGPGHCLC